MLRLRGGHCQVPCGIFDDAKLVADMHEAAATIRKAMVETNKLFAESSAQNFNQMTRWINTKEEHWCTPAHPPGRCPALTPRQLQDHHRDGRVLPLPARQAVWLAWHAVRVAGGVRHASPRPAAPRVAHSAGRYIQALTAHHAVMQAAMKAKQTVDTAGADKLDAALGEFAKMYLPK